MAFCGEASAWAKIALLLIVSANAIHSAGLGTPYWMKTATVSNNVHLIIGLWKMVNCSGENAQPCIGQALEEKYETRLMRATRQLELIVVILGLGALVLASYYVLSPGVRTQRVAVWIMVISFFTMVVGIVGSVTWIVNVPEKHYVFWSMGLTLVGSTLYMMSGLLMVSDIRMYDYQHLEEKRKKKKAKKLMNKIFS